MSPEQPAERKAALRLEYAASHRAFHALLDALSDADFTKQSLNPSWTNGELLFHMALGFFVLASLLPLARFFGHVPKASSQPLASLLNRGTRPFNWTNALSTRLGGRILRRRSLGNIFDWVHARLVQSLERVHDEDWDRGGMYAPTRWDAVSFQDYMTLEDLYRMPLRHFALHREQLAR
jgi:hypothetical protein